MNKKRINRLNKEFYVTDEYGHSDAVPVRKINELIEIVNIQQKIIKNLELMLKENGEKRRRYK